MQDEISAAKHTLMRLRDAFEEIHGTPANPDSKHALDMISKLQRWEEEYGADALTDSAGATYQGCPVSISPSEVTPMPSRSGSQLRF